ncbi:hypothetical protein Fmac_018464 [Flemingia macrophylla]|uniref:Beta-glucosidase n=1 Tax=Flemingia macrophylla TaxID=520843 RepID=A0ABD1M546_9FABA
METKSSITFILYLTSALLIVVSDSVASIEESFAGDCDTSSLKRSNFPKDFLFGTSSSAYQEDVEIMNDIGFDAYRFSISWSRLLPGLKPFITLVHYDHPQSLEDAYGGFLSPNIVKDFVDYAEVCFKAFGDRVKYWITINGPQIFSQLGYTTGEYAPGRCSNWLDFNCNGGDSATEPYLVTHHQLLAHAATVKVYREKYQIAQKGQIGIIHSIDWIIPLTQSPADIDAAFRARAFKVDWTIEPLNSGSYPIEMVHYVGERLPKFSKEQSDMLKNSFDFIGINYYSTAYAADDECPTENKSYLTDFCAMITYERDGIPIGPRVSLEMCYMISTGQEREGYDDFNDEKASLKDQERIVCHIQHLSYVHNAILNGVDVRGYFAWSLLDNFEWSYGYTVRFGIVYVNYTDGLERHPKDSAKWFKRFLSQEFESQ